MEFKTKFNHRDKVYMITKYMTFKIEECETCNGLGKIAIKEKTFTCPNCNGYSRKIPDKFEWQINEKKCGEIGKIIVESYDKRYCKKYEDYDYKELAVKYMINSTGIGSGTLWDEEDLFLTEEEALEECEKRNKEEK